MPNSAVIIPRVENELVRDYLSETKGMAPLRRYVVQLDVHVSQTKDWNALHRAINDHKPKDAKQLVFAYMDKDRLDEKKIAEVALNQLDPKAQRDPDAPVIEIQMIDDHRVSADAGQAAHICRVHIEIPIVHDDWGALRDALRDARRADAYEIISGNIEERHFTEPLRAALQAALGYAP